MYFSNKYQSMPKQAGLKNRAYTNLGGLQLDLTLEDGELGECEAPWDDD